MAEISWIKLSIDIPDNRKIKRIRKMPDGDKIILFWVFLLARAGESNKSGGLFITDTLPYSVDDLSADFDFTVEFVQFAILTLEKYSMITKYDEVLFIKNWEEYQSIEGMEKVREQNRQRQAVYREKQKQLTLGNVTPNVNSNADITQSNGTDIELELDKDIDKDIKNSIPFAEIISYLNEKTGRKFKNVESNKKFIRARWNEGYVLEDFKTVIENKVASWSGAVFQNGANGEKYLQPSTLFGTKFDNYLNEVRIKTDVKDDTDNTGVEF